MRKFQVIAIFLFAAGIMLFAAGCQQTVDGILDVLISPTPSATRSATITLTATLPSATPSGTWTPEPTTPLPPTDTATSTETATASPTGTETSTVTPGPSPTFTRTPTVTRTPTRTRRPTITRSPTRTRTITPTPTNTYTPTPPNANLRISRPGLLSKVSPPIRMEVLVQAGEDGWVRIDLFGEDNRLITQQMLDYRRNPNSRFWVSPQIPFDITAAAEAGRLVVSSQDLSGRTIYLTSVDLILMKTGRDEVHPPSILLQPYLIRYPRPGQTIEGGTVVVVGLARPVNQTPLILELIDENKNIIGSAKVQVDPPSGDLSHTPFQIGISYSVQGTTPVRLTVRQESDGRIPGTVELYSLPLELNP